MHVISFPQTSNAKLDKTLAEIRQLIILPSYLSFDQRKQMYKQKYKEKLESDPITMQIDSEIIRFRHVDIFSLPNTQKIFKEALSEMRTPEDFRLIPKLLEGICVHAGRKLPWQELVRIVRKTSSNDCLYVALDCVAASKRTGFRLTRSEVVNDLLTALQKDVIDSQYSEEKTRKALAWSERIIEMLEDPNHKPSSKEQLRWSRGFPLNRDPQVLATRLHLAAARAVKHNGGEDVDGKVAKYAEELTRLWTSEGGLLSLHEKKAYNDSDRMRYLRQPNQFLWYASPILSGLRLAAQVTDGTVAARLAEITAAVDAEVQWALGEVAGEGKTATNAEGQTLRGMTMYNTLFAAEEKVATEEGASSEKTSETATEQI